MREQEVCAISGRRIAALCLKYLKPPNGLVITKGGPK